MKKTSHKLIAGLFACVTMTSCVNEAPDEDPVSSDRQNQYTIAWIKSFGLIDSNQDWCMVSAVQAEVTMQGKVNQVKVYNGDPAEGGHLIGATSHDGSMLIDVPKGTDNVYVRRTRSSGTVVDEGYYPIVNGTVKIDRPSDMPGRALSRSRDEVTYAHDPSYFDAMLICEDLGSIGDNDFNDIVIGLKHTSGDNPTLTILPMAAGGVLVTDIYFKTERLGEIHDMIKPGNGNSVMLNTSADNIGLVTDLNFTEIDLSAYPGWTIANGWGDISIHVLNKDNTVKITKSTKGKAPQMICLGGDWFWPKEQVDIRTSYKGFASWSCDANATTWLGAWTDRTVVKWNVPGGDSDPVDTRMWYKVTTVDGSPYSVRINGSTTTTQGVSNEVYYVTTPWTSCKDMFTVYSDSQAFILDHGTGDYIWDYPITDNNIKTVEFSDNFDMSAVTTFERMFAGSPKLTSVNTADWLSAPTSALKNADSMFRGCASLTSLDLSGWDVTGVTTFFDAFYGCTALTALNIDGWTFDSAADLRYMLDQTSGLTITCSAEAQAKMSGATNIGGTDVRYTRP